MDTALNLLKEAAQWLKNKNINYWQNWLKPSDSYKNWIKQGFDQNQFYFVENNKNNIERNVIILE